jgi:DNA repair protein RadA/Sms
MAKQRTIYECQNCGAQSPRWLGRCPDCGQWNTYAEETPLQANTRSPVPELSSHPTPLPEIDGDGGTHITTGIGELDHVLGSGYVPGSVTLLGGDPGIGKSTILLQAVGAVARMGKTALYVSGEESAAQIKLRADRLDVHSQHLLVVTENCLERIIEHVKKVRPGLVVLDSIQTTYTSDIPSSPGTISQVRESAGKFLQFCKATGTAGFLVGHVTKDGAIAGPKVLEHLVDTVLYFEGERGHPFRILRTVKNRFGSTNEIGVFEMTGKGLVEVKNPSGIFLAERQARSHGSAVVASLEGSRPVLLELQALVSSSGLANPRRTAIGIDSGRMALLIAVLEKKVGLDLRDQDVFLNVAGGIKIVEPASDLGVIASIYSSFNNQSLDHETILIGEVGLTGEVRAVQGVDVRLKEAEKMGFIRAIIPQANLKSTRSTSSGQELPMKIEVKGISHVEELLKIL